MLKVLPVLIVVGLFAGILGAVHWNEVKTRQEAEQWLAQQAAIAVPPEQIAQAKDILQKAIVARAADDEIRSHALAEAYANGEPHVELGPCSLPVSDLSYAEILKRTSFTFLGKTAPSWISNTSSELTSALRNIDRRVQAKLGSGKELGDELVRDATRLATETPPPVDLQLVVERFEEPRVGSSEFSAGLLAGTLLAYDRTTKKVACGAHLAGTSSSEVSYVKSSNNPAQLTQTPETAVWSDLLKNLLTHASTKLVLLGPRQHDAKD